jgi:hypothetical protein
MAPNDAMAKGDDFMMSRSLYLENGLRSAPYAP